MKYKVIQWATGAMGKSCLRAIIDHPDLELVGLYVYNDSKTGKVKRVFRGHESPINAALVSHC